VGEEGGWLDDLKVRLRVKDCMIAGKRVVVRVRVNLKF
jgi:hypothetical protein